MRPIRYFPIPRIAFRLAYHATSVKYGSVDSIIDGILIFAIKKILKYQFLSTVFDCLSLARSNLDLAGLRVALDS